MYNRQSFINIINVIYIAQDCATTITTSYIDCGTFFCTKLLSLALFLNSSISVIFFSVIGIYIHTGNHYCLCVAKPPRHSGKDMANIVGLSELLDDKPVVVKRKKHTRHLTKLDSDETEDDSEEFQLSE